MNKTTLTAAAVLVAGVASVAHYRHNVGMIIDRFPQLNLDFKTASAAYRTMIKRGFDGKYDLTDNSNETYNRIFTALVHELRSK